MTPITDELLAAYADGELDVATRGEIERAIAGDAVLAERARRQAALRTRVQAAFGPLLADPVPERLLRALQAAPAAAAPASAVVDLGSARAARDARDARAARDARDARDADEARRARGTRRWTQDWTAWGGIAASVLVGVLIGRFAAGPGADTVAFETQAGRLVARGAVEQALSTQLASAPAPGAAVAVQLSFVDKAGHYCRTFSTAAMAGLACRDGATWSLQQAAAAEAGTTGAMRQAASALPAAILTAVDQRIDGAPLDAAAERAALRGGWQR